MSQFSNLHPFIPQSQAAGYLEMFEEIRRHLCLITGYDEISLHPNSGAQGELAGLMTIRNYLIGRWV
jgi:glycine dehydrogenase